MYLQLHFYPQFRIGSIINSDNSQEFIFLNEIPSIFHLSIVYFVAWRVQTFALKWFEEQWLVSSTAKRWHGNANRNCNILTRI